jgi:hypothetical protein
MTPPHTANPSHPIMAVLRSDFHGKTWNGVVCNDLHDLNDLVLMNPTLVLIG